MSGGGGGGKKVGDPVAFDFEVRESTVARLGREGARPGLQFLSSGSSRGTHEDGWAAGLVVGLEVGLRWVHIRAGREPPALLLPAPRKCHPLPHRTCLASPRREKSEDAYVQGDSAGAPSNLRLSGLSNILPGGEMWETVGLRGLLSFQGSMCLFCRTQNPHLNSASVQEGAPWGDIAWGGNPGHLEAAPLWILPVRKLFFGSLRAAFPKSWEYPRM